MKKKNLAILISSIIAVVIISGSLYYKFNYIDTTTEYYRIYFTPPSDEESSFGTYSSDPKVEVERAGNYKNDSAAVSFEKKNEEQFQKSILKGFEKCFSEDKDGILKTAKINAYKDLMSRQLTIVRITHRAGYTPKDAYNFIKTHKDNLKDYEKFCKDNKISCAYYPL